MLLPPDSAPPPPLNAVAYRRAHAGKLMVISRAEDREPALSDFFRFDEVGTHPDGLFVTGIFDENRRAHMKALSVRDANEAEIAWWNNARK